MDANAFVANWVQHKGELLDEFCDANSETLVQKLIGELELNSTQRIQLRRVIDAALTDTMYGLLLGLDGEASIGGDQRAYRIVDETNGQEIAGPGELESAAYECFHGK